MARLLAATMSLALVFASLLGAAAHAREATHHSQHRHQSQLGHHHGHQHAMAAQATSVHAVSKVVVAAAWRGPHGAVAAVDGPEPDGADLKHACCMDFICHGCIAIVATGTGWQVSTWHEARTLPWDVQALASVSPARLDRPPKPLVSA